MRREYESYFAEQFRKLRRSYSRRFRGAPIYPPYLTEALLARIPKSWRSDARFFLASNMLEMVVAPYDDIEGPDVDLLPGGRVWELIFQDLDKLISESERIANERGRAYVSGTSVAVALGRMVETLRTTSLQIWGPEDSGS